MNGRDEAGYGGVWIRNNCMSIWRRHDAWFIGKCIAISTRGGSLDSCCCRIVGTSRSVKDALYYLADVKRLYIGFRPQDRTLNTSHNLP